MTSVVITKFTLSLEEELTSHWRAVNSCLPLTTLMETTFEEHMLNNPYKTSQWSVLDSLNEPIDTIEAPNEIDALMKARIKYPADKPKVKLITN